MIRSCKKEMGTTLTEQEATFYMWATKVPSELPKGVIWELFPDWLRSQKDIFLQKLAPVVEELIDEFPGDFPGDKKITKKAIVTWWDSCQVNYQPTPADDAAWNEIVEKLLPYWEEVCHTSYDTGKTVKLGYRCTAPKEMIDKASELWGKTSYAQKMFAQCPLGSGVYWSIPQPKKPLQAKEEVITQPTQSKKQLPVKKIPAPAPASAPVPTSAFRWKEGDRVSHPTLGAGTITKVLGVGGKTTFAVKFDSYGLKIVEPSSCLAGAAGQEVKPQLLKAGKPEPIKRKR